MNVYKIARMVTELGPDWYKKASDTEWYSELTSSVESLHMQVRAWVGRQGIDPALSRCLDAFVHRVDKDLLSKLAANLNSAGLTNDQQRPIWESLTRRTTLVDMRRFLDRSVDDIWVEALRQGRQHESAEPPAPQEDA